jgi:hypothetical protein
MRSLWDSGSSAPYFHLWQKVKLTTYL